MGSFTCSNRYVGLFFVVGLLAYEVLAIAQSEITDIPCYKDTVYIPVKGVKGTYPNVTICDIQQCPMDCLCTLGNSTLITRCNNGNEISAAISYVEEIQTIYLGDISLDDINPFAFSSIGSAWKQLYLNDNNLTELQPGVFDGLTNLERLSLYRNKLNGLHLKVFTGLDSLLYLDLRKNVISKVQPDQFLALTSLLELSLDDNQIVELPSGVFRGLTNLLEVDVDGNPLLEKVALNVFNELINLIELDIDNNAIGELQPGVFDGLSNLKELEIDGNKLTKISEGLFAGLDKIEGLAISENLINEIDPFIFSDMTNLKQLFLQGNNISVLHPSLFRKASDLEVLFINSNNLKELHPDIFRNLTNLKTLSIAEINISYLPNTLFQDLRALEFLNVSRNEVNSISSKILHELTNLLTLDLTKNPLYWIQKESFEHIPKRTVVYVDEYATCCFVTSGDCSFTEERSPFISCKRLLPFTILRIVIWIVSFVTVAGNLFVLIKRIKNKPSRVNVQFLLITNLSFSDLMTGVYLIILLSVDLWYKEYFPSHSDSWRHSSLCKVAGALSLLSSEASVFLITLISIDRFMSIKFPLSAAKLGNKSVKVVLAILWLVAGLISIASMLIPLKSDLYEASEICVGLPISRVNSYEVREKSFKLNTTSIEGSLNTGYIREAVFTGSKPSMFFSIAIFTVLNLVCFLVVAFCYASIFYIAKQASRIRGADNKNREIRRAFKMAGIVLSDFCCWLVVIILSVLVQSEAITISPEAYAWIATFVLPINSCINPFLYSFSALISKRLQRKIDPLAKNDTVMMSATNT